MNLIQCASYSRKGILKIPVAKTSHYRRGENIRYFAGLLEFGSARFGGFYRALRGRHRLQRDGQRLATYEFHVMQIWVRTIGPGIAAPLIVAVVALRRV
jgi:hypothetical protein